jgi:hypothetical protein
VVARFLVANTAIVISIGVAIVDGQPVLEAQLRDLRAIGCEKIFSEQVFIGRAPRTIGSGRAKVTSWLRRLADWRRAIFATGVLIEANQNVPKAPSIDLR